MNVKLKKGITAFFFLAALALALFIKANPDFFTSKERGSFEYFRTAELSLSKGKYADAISYFAKAYDMSPENRTIKSGLVYAYSKYAMVLAEQGSYDKAVDYLKKACDVISNASTVQNLALMYSKKALSSAEAANWTASMEDLANARQTVEGLDAPARVLAGSLFADAVKEYNLGREAIALLFIKESVLLYEDVRALQFLGSIYYKRGELDKTLFYWNRAKALDPSDKVLAEKLSRLGMETELKKAEATRKLPHFEIRYEKDLAADPQVVSEALDEAYRSVGADLNYFPASKTVVYLYSANNFRKIFKLPDVVRAFYDGNIRMPLQSLPDKNDLSRYIRHEYTHAILSAKTANRCPVWLSEGIAVWEEFKGDEAFMATLLQNMAGDPQTSIDMLEKAFSQAGEMARDGKDMRIYYLLAYSAVRYIVDTWGPGTLNAILDRIAKGQHAVNAIDDELLLSQKEFEARWKEHFIKGRRP